MRHACNWTVRVIARMHARVNGFFFTASKKIPSHF